MTTPIIKPAEPGILAPLQSSELIAQLIFENCILNIYTSNSRRIRTIKTWSMVCKTFRTIFHNRIKLTIAQKIKDIQCILQSWNMKEHRFDQTPFYTNFKPIHNYYIQYYAFCCIKSDLLDQPVLAEITQSWKKDAWITDWLINGQEYHLAKIPGAIATTNLHFMLTRWAIIYGWRCNENEWRLALTWFLKDDLTLERTSFLFFLMEYANTSRVRSGSESTGILEGYTAIVYSILKTKYCIDIGEEESRLATMVIQDHLANVFTRVGRLFIPDDSEEALLPKLEDWKKLFSNGSKRVKRIDLPVLFVRQ